jgi:SNF2 family DNA or RNA helicase
MVLLDEKFTAVETPPKFKGGLYEHQKVVVKALLDLESKRHINCISEDNKEKYIIDNHACILSEKLGSGKTIEILALICFSRTPTKILPKPVNVNHLKVESSYFTYGMDDYNYDHIDTQIKRLYPIEIQAKYSSKLNSNLIVVNKSVLVQWEKAIEHFTHLTYFTIGDIRSLKIFYTMYLNGTLNYDIILLKSNHVTNFYLRGENPNLVHSSRSFIDVVALMCEATPFSRVIYDDFDTITSAGENVMLVNAFYSIFVSTTRNHTFARYNNLQGVTKKTSIDTLQVIHSLFERRYLMNVYNDVSLFEIFNIRTTPVYMDWSTNIPTFEIYKSTYKNPSDNYLTIMKDLGANNVVEMMNGDAIQTAADSLGITSKSPFDIFKRLLNNKYDIYIASKNRHLKYEAAISHISKLSDMANRPPRVENKVIKHWPENHTEAQIKDIIDDINKMEKYKMLDIDFKSQNLIFALNNQCHSAKNEMEMNGLVITRMKENLREQLCVVCKMDIDGEDIIIPRCCSNIIGSDCFRTAQLESNGDSAVLGKCPGCSKKINIVLDLAYIKAGIDIDALIDAQGDEVIEEPVAVIDESVNKIDNPKLQALWDIIGGKMPASTKPVSFQISSVIDGMYSKPLQPETPRKILMFANYNETLDMVEDFLKTKSISYLRLLGDYHHMHNIVCEFDKLKSGILLINSSKNCAGLNLQSASTIIFFHKLDNRHIESQVIGRAQRIGRTTSLQIYYLLYNNEAHHVDDNMHIL